MAQGSHSTWSPNSPRTCHACGAKIVLGKEGAFFSTLAGAPRSWHAACAPYRVRVVVEWPQEETTFA